MNSAYGEWPSLYDIVKTSWTPAGFALRALDTPSSSSASARTPTTGSYAEGGYVYWYNASTGALTITYSPKSGGKTAIPVTKGTAAYNAILAKIRGGLQRLTNDQVRAYRSHSIAAGPVVSDPPLAPAATSLPEVPSTEPAVSDDLPPIWRRPWFAPALVVGLGGLLLLLFLLPRPRR